MKQWSSMNIDTIVTIVFIIVCVIVFTALIIRAYLQWKLIKTLRDLPEDQKPLAGFSKNTRAVIALILIAVGSFGIYSYSKRSMDFKSTREIQAIQSKREYYEEKNPANSPLSYEFRGNTLLFRESGFLQVSAFPSNFCSDMKNALWSVDDVSSDGQYLIAFGSCNSTLPDIEKPNTRTILIDLTSKKTIIDSKESTQFLRFSKFVTPTTVMVYVRQNDGTEKVQTYNIATKNLE